MSTRSTISMQNDDGTIDTIYCHYDGFPDNNGTMLLQNYDEKDKVRELINLGDISFLGPTTKQEDTKSYFRWRQDPIDITRNTKASGIDRQDYNYLWRDDMWWMSEWSGEWMPLDQIIMETKKEKFYPRINEVAEQVNEIYDPEYAFIRAEDMLPTYVKKNFRDVVKDIQRNLSRENFTEIEIEDYLKRLIEEIVE